MQQPEEGQNVRGLPDRQSGPWRAATRGLHRCARPCSIVGLPEPAWSRDLAAQLSRELVGHAAVGHLRLDVNDIVQADQIVLEGVEQREAPALGDALERAVDAANRASTAVPNPPPNMAQKEADGIARTIEIHQP